MTEEEASQTAHKATVLAMQALEVLDVAEDWTVFIAAMAQLNVLAAYTMDKAGVTLFDNQPIGAEGALHTIHLTSQDYLKSFQYALNQQA